MSCRGVRGREDRRGDGGEGGDGAIATTHRQLALSPKFYLI